MVVNTEILLRAWRGRWTPLQWLVEVKKLAGKDNEELQDLAGNFLFMLNIDEASRGTSVMTPRFDRN